MPWKSPKEVAQQLGYSVEHVRRLVREGAWKTWRPPEGTSMRILVDELGQPVAQRKGSAR